ncbi:MAG TPA: hypothetical protein VHX16_17640, partial [Chloroflexota bacterium]|nr:hypothetical protein [Chloroflexota bacterium]
IGVAIERVAIGGGGSLCPPTRCSVTGGQGDPPPPVWVGARRSLTIAVATQHTRTGAQRE